MKLKLFLFFTILVFLHPLVNVNVYSHMVQNKAAKILTIHSAGLKIPDTTVYPASDFASIKILNEFEGTMYLDGAYIPEADKSSMLLLRYLSPGLHSLEIKGKVSWDSTFSLDKGQIFSLRIFIKKKNQKKHKEFDHNNRLQVNDTTAGNFLTVDDYYPCFPGGDAARLLYLDNSIKYPLKAKQDRIQGRVFVSYVIERDGSITNVKLLRGIGGGCDEEALKAVKNMPRWIPGKQKGKTVRVEFTMPILFRTPNQK